jgi:hypothetical protein
MRISGSRDRYELANARIGMEEHRVRWGGDLA